MTDNSQLGMNLPNTQNLDKVEGYKFEKPPNPIKGYPKLYWSGQRPFTSTQFYPAQQKESHGADVDGWRNKIFWGDNLQVMSHLLKDFRGKVNLVYIDPPFDSDADYKKKIKLREKSITNDQNTFEEKQYTDIWTNDEYLQFMYERIILLRELLTENGVICVHCDWHKSHYLRYILEEVFGGESFRNEIVWYYYNKMQGNINRFASNHDVILVYTKSPKFTFNKIREEREKPIEQIKRVWDSSSKSLVNAKDENGNVLYITSTHKTIDDVWRLPILQPADKVEVVGYPTQKPECVVERIVLAFSNPEDLVFDCFMGSGTTQSVAMKYGRKFLGTDINLGAVQTTTKRLLELKEKIEGSLAYQPFIKNGLRDKNANIENLTDEEGEIVSDSFSVNSFFTGFEVYNVNHYDVFRNPLEAKDLLLEALEIQRLDQGNLFDGEKDGRMVKIMPVNRICTRADLSEIIAGLDYKTFERRQNEAPNKPVEKITLVCMGHEPDLAATLISEVKPFNIDVEVVDILRDKSNLEFKRDSEAKIKIDGDYLIIDKFYPMNLLQKLSLQQENVEDWRELVESVMIDWNYDGAILEPKLVDIPDKKELVSGRYKIPEDAGTIRVKITDLLSESLEVNIDHG